MSNMVFRENELGEIEKRCNQCKEYWPHTCEFFPHTKNGTLTSPCKACLSEHRQRNQQKKCCVMTCRNMRWGNHRRCKKHQQTYTRFKRTLAAKRADASA